jgi:hypothetical protein
MPILLAGTIEIVHIEKDSALFTFRLGQVLLYYISASCCTVVFNRFLGYVAVCVQLYRRCFAVLRLVVAVLHYMFRPTWPSSRVYDVLLLYSWRNLLRWGFFSCTWLHYARFHLWGGLNMRYYYYYLCYFFCSVIVYICFYLLVFFCCVFSLVFWFLCVCLPACRFLLSVGFVLLSVVYFV